MDSTYHVASCRLKTTRNNGSIVCQFTWFILIRTISAVKVVDKLVKKIKREICCGWKVIELALAFYSPRQLVFQVEPNLLEHRDLAVRQLLSPSKLRQLKRGKSCEMTYTDDHPPFHRNQWP